MATVLITGGCGYLGTHIGKELRRSNDDVRVILFDLVGAAVDLQDFEHVQGDICNTAQLRNALECFQVTGVIHTAGYGLSGTLTLPAYDEITRKVNIEGTRSVIEACQTCGVKVLSKFRFKFI